MGSIDNDYDLVLSAPSPVEAALAKDLLAEEGIPSFTHGADRNMAELGAGVNNMLTRPSLYVPKGMRERAEQVLAEAWNAEPLPDEGSTPPSPVDANAPEWSSSAAHEEAAMSTSSGSGWMLLVAVALLTLAAMIWVIAKS